MKREEIMLRLGQTLSDLLAAPCLWCLVQLTSAFIPSRSQSQLLTQQLRHIQCNDILPLPISHGFRQFRNQVFSPSRTSVSLSCRAC
ncbi:hypothetical protein BD769DRAFT_1508402 [Suillus cothurnatus]|nr:hypothetical protein BD769DRAFT_1508402 [Suillus cothurnatus]